MYKYVLNSVVKVLMMFAKYFEYYTIILRGRFFVDTLYVSFSHKKIRTYNKNKTSTLRKHNIDQTV